MTPAEDSPLQHGCPEPLTPVLQEFPECHLPGLCGFFLEQSILRLTLAIKKQCFSISEKVILHNIWDLQISQGTREGAKIKDNVKMYVLTISLGQLTL